ncbi:hypothetical protein K438DRAFT_1782016 [Mycena galopus ATCC 62051]|nr:hypothetical protein K438DRAFT_1782016 [Mycena galopus ATCC 62051]
MHIISCTRFRPRQGLLCVYRSRYIPSGTHNLPAFDRRGIQHLPKTVFYVYEDLDLALASVRVFCPDLARVTPACLHQYSSVLLFLFYTPTYVSHQADSGTHKDLGYGICNKVRAPGFPGSRNWSGLFSCAGRFRGRDKWKRYLFLKRNLGSTAVTAPPYRHLLWNLRLSRSTAISLIRTYSNSDPEKPSPFRRLFISQHARGGVCVFLKFDPDKACSAHTGVGPVRHAQPSRIRPRIRESNACLRPCFMRTQTFSSPRSRTRILILIPSTATISMSVEPSGNNDSDSELFLPDLGNVYCPDLARVTPACLHQYSSVLLFLFYTLKYVPHQADSGTHEYLFGICNKVRAPGFPGNLQLVWSGLRVFSYAASSLKNWQEEQVNMAWQAPAISIFV